MLRRLSSATASVVATATADRNASANASNSSSRRQNATLDGGTSNNRETDSHLNTMAKNPSIALSASSPNAAKIQHQVQSQSLSTRKSQRRVQLSFSDSTGNGSVNCNSERGGDYDGEDDSSTRRTRQPRNLISTARQVGAHTSGSNRLAAPRLSLLGKPIYLNPQKSYYNRNTTSMRWKMRLRSFLEQPQGPLAWLYHCSL